MVLDAYVLRHSLTGLLLLASGGAARGGAESAHRSRRGGTQGSCAANRMTRVVHVNPYMCRMYVDVGGMNVRRHRRQPGHHRRHPHRAIRAANGSGGRVAPSSRGHRCSTDQWRLHESPPHRFTPEACPAGPPPPPLPPPPLMLTQPHHQRPRPTPTIARTTVTARRERRNDDTPGRGRVIGMLPAHYPPCDP